MRVDFELAKLAADKGYNEKHIYAYNKEKELGVAYMYNSNPHPKYICTAPTLRDLHDWLIKQGIIVNINPNIHRNEIVYNGWVTDIRYNNFENILIFLDDLLDNISERGVYFHNDYYKVLEASIKYGLNLL